ncbi:MAG: hypothetical protein ACK4RK_13150 [Gemmataceae bacterium]
MCNDGAVASARSREPLIHSQYLLIGTGIAAVIGMIVWGLEYVNKQAKPRRSSGSFADDNSYIASQENLDGWTYQDGEWQRKSPG